MLNLSIGILLPFIGTTLGSMFVFFLRNRLNSQLEKLMLGFAAGVMMAASVWSLIIPAINSSNVLGRFDFFPASVGIILGLAFLIIIDRLSLNKTSKQTEVNKTNKSNMLLFAVTLHNIPEGMAVGIALASAFIDGMGISIAASIALSIGIAIQNIPEGAIISMPLRGAGYSKLRAFSEGVLSGIVEPISAIITVLLVDIIIPILPYLLSFAAGSMIYVVVAELIPEAQDGFNYGVVSFIFGFLVMMILDVVLA